MKSPKPETFDSDTGADEAGTDGTERRFRKRLSGPARYLLIWIGACLIAAIAVEGPGALREWRWNRRAEAVAARAMRELGPAPTSEQAVAWLRANGFEGAYRHDGHASIEEERERGAFMSVDGMKILDDGNGNPKDGTCVILDFQYDLPSMKFNRLKHELWPLWLWPYGQGGNDRANPAKKQQ